MAYAGGFERARLQQPAKVKGAIQSLLVPGSKHVRHWLSCSALILYAKIS